MGYKALVTLDLSGEVSTEQRNQFYQKLEELKWVKIQPLTTAWKVSFTESVTREDAIKILLNDLDKAKDASKVKKVEYALQLDRAEVVVGSK
jgi:hypothetical protein